MSYSVCINCERMVPAYEKYCLGCLGKHPQLQQDEDFWRSYYYTMEAARELAKEEIERTETSKGAEK